MQRLRRVFALCNSVSGTIHSSQAGWQCLGSSRLAYPLVFLSSYSTDLSETCLSVAQRLPARIILVRHAECGGLDDAQSSNKTPNHKIPLTALGEEQAKQCGVKLRQLLLETNPESKLFVYSSPFLRAVQTSKHIIDACEPYQFAGFQEEVQLREQDWGNFQDAVALQANKDERVRYGRFFYRFPNGESAADVYNRMTIFQDHLVRDCADGRFDDKTNLVLVTHGLSLRVFLMRWLHWPCDQFLGVFNAPNAVPIVLEKAMEPDITLSFKRYLVPTTKSLYRLTKASQQALPGISDEMCSTKADWAWRVSEFDPSQHTAPHKDWLA